MIIAVAGASKKDYLEKRISPELERIIENRTTYVTDDENKPIKIYYEDDNVEEYVSMVISPIVMQGDPIGSVILLSKEANSHMGDMEVMLLETASKFLSKQMEN